MKKLFVVLLIALSVFSVFANAETEAKTATNEKVIVNFWHTFKAGVNGDTINAAVEKFNSTIGAEENIEVIATYQGAYNDVQSKVLSAIAANGEIPQVVLGERSNNIPVYWDEGILVDMTDYVKASTKMSMDNFIPALTGFSYSPNGEIISFPYCRSSFLLYYNKSLLDSYGIAEPKSFADLEALSRQLVDKGITGFCFWHDFSPEYAVVAEMGSEIFSDGGAYPAHLTDGTMLELLTWWKNAVDDGWMCKYPSTSPDDTLGADMLQNRVACLIASTGDLGGYIKGAKEAGVELGVTAFPAWYNGVQKAPIGGGNIAMIGASNTKAQKDAAWKFIEFMLQDEQVAAVNKNTGYLVTTKSALNSDTIKQYWTENPEYRVAYDAVLNYGVELPFSLYKPNYSGLIKAPISSLIIEGSITPEQAIEQIYNESKKVFPNM